VLLCATRYASVVAYASAAHSVHFRCQRYVTDISYRGGDATTKHMPIRCITVDQTNMSVLLADHD
jgi:hypothetical protein